MQVNSELTSVTSASEKKLSMALCNGPRKKMGGEADILDWSWPTCHFLLALSDFEVQHPTLYSVKLIKIANTKVGGSSKQQLRQSPPHPTHGSLRQRRLRRRWTQRSLFYYHRLSLSLSKEGGGWEEVCNRQKQSFAFWSKASSLWRPCWRGTWTWTSSSRTRWTRWTRWTWWTPSCPPCQGAAQENGRLGQAQRPVSSTTANVHLHTLLNDIYYFTSNCSFTSSCTSSCTNNNIFTCLRVATFASGSPQPRWLGQVQGRELDPRDSGVHDQSCPWGLGGPVGVLRPSCPDSVSGGRTSDDATYIE